MKIFADDVIGTKFDQKYFQCILSEYLTNFESFSPENGIVEVSLIAASNLQLTRSESKKKHVNRQSNLNMLIPNIISFERQIAWAIDKS